MRLVTVASTLGLAMAVGGCGVAKAPVEAPAKPIQLEVSPAKFSKTKQRPGDDVVLSMTVTNTGQAPAPNLLVQLMGLDETTIADPQDEGRERTTKTDLPNATKRAAWFIDDSPEGSPLSNSHLYPAGRLEPGRTRTLRWRLNAQQPGNHTLKYQVWGGLTDNQAKATSGTGLTGSISATISDK